MKTFFRLRVIVGALPVTLTNGTTADATQVMSDLNWIVNQVNANAAPLVGTALTNANNNFTVVQSGVAASASANFPIASQVQNSVFDTFQSTLGTNTLTARCAALALTAWPTDGVFSFIPSQTNTGPASLAVDSAGSSIIFSMGSTLVGGELRAGVPAFVKRDATRLNLQNSANVRFDLTSSTNTSGVRILISSTPGPISIGKQPTRQVITATGAGTYTRPLGCTRINVRLNGSGAGGEGAGAVIVSGTVGNATTFDTMTGGAGQNNGAASSASGGDINFPGAGGSGGGLNASTPVFLAGGPGGNSVFGGAGRGGLGNGNGGSAVPNSGAGGGGGAGGSGQSAGGNGGAGGYVEKLIIFPLSTYAYSVGAKGTGGVGTTTTGGDGADGIIIVDESYN